MKSTARIGYTLGFLLASVRAGLGSIGAPPVAFEPGRQPWSGSGRGIGHRGKAPESNIRRYRNRMARASRVAQLKAGRYRR